LCYQIPASALLAADKPFIKMHTQCNRQRKLTPQTKGVMIDIHKHYHTYNRTQSYILNTWIFSTSMRSLVACLSASQQACSRFISASTRPNWPLSRSCSAAVSSRACCLILAKCAAYVGACLAIASCNTHCSKCPGLLDLEICPAGRTDLPSLVRCLKH